MRLTASFGDKANHTAESRSKSTIGRSEDSGVLPFSDTLVHPNVWRSPFYMGHMAIDMK